LPTKNIFKIRYTCREAWCSEIWHKTPQNPKGCTRLKKSKKKEKKKEKEPKRKKKRKKKSERQLHEKIINSGSSRYPLVIY